MHLEKDSVLHYYINIWIYLRRLKLMLEFWKSYSRLLQVRKPLRFVLLPNFTDMLLSTLCNMEGHYHRKKFSRTMCAIGRKKSKTSERQRNALFP